MMSYNSGVWRRYCRFELTELYETRTTKQEANPSESEREPLDLRRFVSLKLLASNGQATARALAAHHSAR